MTHFLLPFFYWLQNSPLGHFVSSSSWVYTIGLMFHFTGMAMLFGAMLVVDLRLLGVTKRIPLPVALAFLPIAIAGFIINLVTGVVFFAFDPLSFWNNIAFKVKLVLLLVAGANALWFTFAEEPKLRTLPPYGDTPSVIKWTAGLSLAVWTLVIVCGRMIVGLAGLK